MKQKEKQETNPKRKMYVLLLALIWMFTLHACGSDNTVKRTDNEKLIYDHSMELTYATQFRIDYYKEGYKIVTIANGDTFIIVPEGKELPEVDEKMTVINQPLDNIYMVSSSQMDLIRALDGLECVKMTGTKESDWYIDEVKDLMKENEILYAGKYNAPDYEMLLSEGCDLAVENTMIYHKPEVKEKIEEIGIPVIVEYSSMEPHPLGRVEWIKLYGALFDREAEAEEFFENEINRLKDITGDEGINDDNENAANPEEEAVINSVGEKATDGEKKTAAYFYVNSKGAVNVRKSGDYIAKMIEIAGGRYLFDNLTDENALSTMNIQMEEFIEKAMEADYLIYNSSIDGKINTIDELLAKCPELKESRAVREGNVWCTEKNMFQETTGIADMILEFHYMITGEEYSFRYMYRLK